MTWFQKVSFPMSDRIPIISPQEAYNTCYCGFFHGTTQESADNILNHGFVWEHGESGSGTVRNGYPNEMYGFTGCKSPVHHLGYGIYLTESRKQAKNFGHKLLEFCILKSARIGSINFASPKTMMKWWVDNGYDCKLAETDRVKATQQLTQNLASKWDAVCFRGKGFRRSLLDGNQICVYNPGIIRRVDRKLAQPGQVGSKVRRKIDGMRGQIVGFYDMPKDKADQYHRGNTKILKVRWDRGGTDLLVYPTDVDLI